MRRVLGAVDELGTWWDPPWGARSSRVSSATRCDGHQGGSEAALPMRGSVALQIVAAGGAEGHGEHWRLLYVCGSWVGGTSEVPHVSYGEMFLTPLPETL